MSDLVPSGLNPMQIAVGNALVNIQNASQNEGADPIMVDIQKTVQLIKKNTDQLTRDQKTLINSLTNNFSSLMGKMATEYSTQAKDRTESKKSRQDYEKKQEAFQRKSYEAYTDALNKIFGVGNKQVEALMKNFEETNRERGMAQKRFEDLTTVIKDQMEGTSKYAQGAQRASVKGQAIANNRMAAGNFVTSLAERTSPMAAFLLQRFAGQSMEGRKAIQGRMAADQSNIQMSKYLAGDEGVENYKMYRDQLEASKKAQFQNRFDIANAIRTGVAPVTPEGSEPMTEVLAGEEEGEAPTTGGFGDFVRIFSATGGDGNDSSVGKLPTPFAVCTFAIFMAIKGGKSAGEEERAKEGKKSPIASLLQGAGSLLSKVGKGLLTVGKSIVASEAFGKVFGKSAKFLGNAGQMAIHGAKGAAGVAARAAIPLAVITESLITAKKLIDINKDQSMTKQKKTVARGGAIGSGLGGMGGGIGGAAAGAALGTLLFPGIGTLIGGALGGVLGGFLGNKAGEAAGKAVGGAIANRGPKPDVKPSFDTGGIVKGSGPGAPVDATVHDGEVVLPNSIAPLYKEIADNTLMSSKTLKTDVMAKLTSIEDLLRDISTKASSSVGFPGATGRGAIGGK